MPRPRKRIAKRRKIEVNDEERVIYEHYNKYRVSDKVNNARIDKSRTIRDDAYVDSIYSRFKMTRYKNKNEFINKMTSKFPYTEDELDTLWREYEHRDELIRRGQYEDIRLQYYKDKYVAALELRNVDEKLINRIKSMSLEDWDRLISTPNSAKSKRNDRALPMLGGGFVTTSPGASDNIKTDEFIKQVKRAFELAGLEYDIDMADTVSLEQAQQDDEIMQRAIDRGNRLVGKNREYVYDEGSDAEYLESLSAIIAEEYDKQGKEVRTSKAGYRYIRGIGSTNPKSKNYLLASKIIIHMKNK